MTIQKTKEEWEALIGKRLYVELNSGRKYSLSIYSVEENVRSVLLNCIDKYGSVIQFNDDQVNILEIQKGVPYALSE